MIDEPGLTVIRRPLVCEGYRRGLRQNVDGEVPKNKHKSGSLSFGRVLECLSAKCISMRIGNGS